MAINGSSWTYVPSAGIEDGRGLPEKSPLDHWRGGYARNGAARLDGLPLSLVIAKEEDAVVQDGTADGTAKLVLVKRRSG